MGTNNSKPSQSPSPSEPSSLSTQQPQKLEVSHVDSSTNTSSAFSNASPEQPLTDTSTASTTNTSSGCPMHRSDGSYSYNPWKIISGAFLTQHGPQGKNPLSKEEAELKIGRVEAAPIASTTSSESFNTASITSDGSVTSSTSSGCPVKYNRSLSSSPPGSNASPGTASGGGCPVKHGGGGSVNANTATGVEYNVYGQLIDPTNQMPYNPNQLPSYNQNIPLSTDRVPSSIPKGGGEAATATTNTWLYPSPQMFYNALQRKNKLQDNNEVLSEETTATTSALQPQDIESVVAIHNNMNEKTWYKILQWESVITNGGSNEIDERNVESKLLKFQGRPMYLSPKAMIKHYLLGHPLPYDRHDWVVERIQYATGSNHDSQPSISTQRYVIDYYYDASRGRNDPESAIPQLHDRQNGSPSLLVDVRPAVDSISALFHRTITMPYSIYVQPIINNTKNRTSADAKSKSYEVYEYLPLWPSSTMKSQVNESIQVWQDIQRQAAGISDKTGEEKENIDRAAKVEQLNVTVQNEIMDQFQMAMKSCQNEQLRMNQACSNNSDDYDEVDERCAKASIDVTVCLGKQLCPIQYQAFQQVIQQNDTTTTTSNDRNNDTTTIIDDAYARIQECLALKSKQYQQVKKMSDSNK